MRAGDAFFEPAFEPCTEGLEGIEEKRREGLATDDMQPNGVRLLSAAEKGDNETVSLLLNEANPNLPDKYTRMALHRAAWRGHTKVVQQLLNQADPSLTDKWGVISALCGRARG